MRCRLEGPGWTRTRATESAASSAHLGTGTTWALETFNPVMLWAAVGPGLIAGKILIAAGVVVDELQQHK